GVNFDAARRMESRSYLGTPLVLNESASVDFPDVEELPNDDATSDYESSEVSADGHFYSYDIPGYRSNNA
ncbi:MAG TPA: hypothetical protein PK867_19290, partial [Pirellulales bacterium]|nr:hypothetical protein [Pirellulales bacterium]